MFVLERTYIDNDEPNRAGLLYTLFGVAELKPEVKSEDHAPLVHLHEIKTSSVLQVSQMASLATKFKEFETI